MKIFTSDAKEKEIKNLDDWFKFCPPEGKEKQWVDDRSAKEMAKFWTAAEGCYTESYPEDFQVVIQKGLKDFEIDYIIPEYVSKFDNFGRSRQHDLFIYGKNNVAIVTVEGKADESFGGMFFGDKFKETITDKIKNNDSKALDRMINLYQNYFKSNGKILEIMYQLAHWFAGSLVDAIKFDTQNFVMVLQEFRSSLTVKEKLETNHDEFEKFIDFISEGKYSKIDQRQILGPINNIFTKGDNYDKNLFIGYHMIDNGYYGYRVRHNGV